MFLSGFILGIISLISLYFYSVTEAGIYMYVALIPPMIWMFFSSLIIICSYSRKDR